MRILTLFLVLSSFTQQSESRASKIIEAFLEAVGGIEKWESFEAFHIEYLTQLSLNEPGGIQTDTSLLNYIEPTLVIWEINMPDHSITNHYKDEKLKATFITDEHNSFALMENMKEPYYFKQRRFGKPFILEIIDSYESKKFEFVSKTTHNGKKYNVLKVYIDDRKSYYFYYFNVVTHLIEIFHEHKDYTSISYISDYKEANGIKYPGKFESYRGDVLYSKSEFLRFEASR